MNPEYFQIYLRTRDKIAAYIAANISNALIRIDVFFPFLAVEKKNPIGISKFLKFGDAAKTTHQDDLMGLRCL